MLFHIYPYWVHVNEVIQSLMWENLAPMTVEDIYDGRTKRTSDVIFSFVIGLRVALPNVVIGKSVRVYLTNSPQACFS